MDMCTALERAIELAGGQSALARQINARQQTVHYWVSVAKRASPDYAIAIETAVDGQVTRYQLRPDVFGVAPDHVGQERAA